MLLNIDSLFWFVFLSPTWILQSLGVLGNITCGTVEQTKLVVQFGVVKPLVTLLASPHSDVVCLTLGVMFNVLQNVPKLHDKVIGTEALRTLFKYFDQNIKVSVPESFSMLEP